uniref:Uncharacterized protein n=1 Tax=Acrobeloides nanus TaxID=290746 RepID=A0A914DZK0_9BILA
MSNKLLEIELQNFKPKTFQQITNMKKDELVAEVDKLNGMILYLMGKRSVWNTLEVTVIATEKIVTKVKDQVTDLSNLTCTELDKIDGKISEIASDLKEKDPKNSITNVKNANDLYENLSPQAKEVSIQRKLKKDEEIREKKERSAIVRNMPHGIETKKF